MWVKELVNNVWRCFCFALPPCLVVPPAFVHCFRCCRGFLGQIPVSLSLSNTPVNFLPPQGPSSLSAGAQQLESRHLIDPNCSVMLVSPLPRESRQFCLPHSPPAENLTQMCLKPNPIIQNQNNERRNKCHLLIRNHAKDGLLEFLFKETKI